KDDIKLIISWLEDASNSVKVTSEIKCSPPSPRSNVTLNAHPEKDSLIMFGGEYFNGKETVMYNDLFYYNIRSNEWSHVIIPNAPTPRCSHQAETVPQSRGQLWLFGGEYTTRNQSQYYHYNDLWVLHLAERKWEKINSVGAPSPRSGHRMVACRKMLFIFGGFQDNTMAYRYYNDVHAFSLESRTWVKLQLSGLPPSPRSGCVMAVTQDQCHIMVYGGYSKQKVNKDVHKGCIHSDIFMLSYKNKMDEKLSWKWSLAKQYGTIPSPRCSTSLCVTSSNKAVLFGGIRDDEEDEENVEGSCFNDMYLLEIDKCRWHPLILRNVKKLKILEQNVNDRIEHISTSLLNQPTTSTKSDEIFKLVINDTKDIKTKLNPPPSNVGVNDDNPYKTFPTPRMRPMLAAKRGVLYLYGGICEHGSRQITLSDFYSIDLQSMNKWNVLLESQDTSMDWQESSDEEESSSDDDTDDEDDEESSDDDDEDDPTKSGPRKKGNEKFEEYFARTSSTWKMKARKVAEKELIEATSKQLDKAASRMASEYWKKISF
ncbi:hypothetical protein HELRODRAFT_65936, partial [Helobdella robusta]|uniref:Kelch domain-containing protein 4 n=1 Tax=Helobdella robusta TaxID=6412 RepID=T1FYE5_HELRO